MNRIKWIDTAKGIAMVLIVLGHTLRSGLIHNIVYYLHVPTFFFLSGITVKEALSAKNMRSDVQRLLIPYYSFGFISIVIYAVLGTVAASRLEVSMSSAWENVADLLYGASWLKFNAPLWFLPALFAMKLWYRILNRLTKGNAAVLVGLTAIGCVLGFYHTRMGRWDMPFSFALVLKLFPFFIAGKLCAPMWFKLGRSMERRPSCVCASGALLAAICVWGGVRTSCKLYKSSISDAACVLRIGNHWLLRDTWHSGKYREYKVAGVFRQKFFACIGNAQIPNSFLSDGQPI